MKPYPETASMMSYHHGDPTFTTTPSSLDRGKDYHAQTSALLDSGGVHPHLSYEDGVGSDNVLSIQ